MRGRYSPVSSPVLVLDSSSFLVLSGPFLSVYREN